MHLEDTHSDVEAKVKLESIPDLTVKLNEAVERLEKLKSDDDHDGFGKRSESLDEAEDILQCLDDIRLSMKHLQLSDLGLSLGLDKATDDVDQFVQGITIRSHRLEIPCTVGIVEMPITPPVLTMSDLASSDVPSGDIIEVTDPDCGEVVDEEVKYSITVPETPKLRHAAPDFVVQLVEAEKEDFYSKVEEGFSRLSPQLSDDEDNLKIVQDQGAQDLSIHSFGEEKGSLINDVELTTQLSVDDSDKEAIISSTPEAEKYFKNIAFAQGSEDQEIEVTEEEIEKSPATLEVMPLSLPSDQTFSEMQVFDLEEEPTLIVRPYAEFEAEASDKIKNNNKSHAAVEDHLSSYEALYDHAQTEPAVGPPGTEAQRLLGQVGDRYRGTTDQIMEHQALSSFENIYAFDTSQEFPVPPGGGQVQNLPDVRWSAPVDSVEPPILQPEDFNERLGAVSRRIESHWQDIEGMIGGVKDDKG